MAKKYIVNIGYNRVVAPTKEIAFAILETFQVEREYIDGEHIYIPKGKDELSIEIVDDSKIRLMTEDEKDNKALKAAESSAEYYKNANKDLGKQIEELKCQVKILTSEKAPDA